jgi:hypothetical protein
LEVQRQQSYNLRIIFEGQIVLQYLPEGNGARWAGAQGLPLILFLYSILRLLTVAPMRGIYLQLKQRYSARNILH